MYRVWYGVVSVIVAYGVVVVVCRKQEQVRLTRMGKVCDMRTRVQAWAVAFVSLVWSPSVVVMISRCCPAARSNATRPATPGMIIPGDVDLLIITTGMSSLSSSTTLHFVPLIVSSIDFATGRKDPLQTALSCKR